MLLVNARRTVCQCATQHCLATFRGHVRKYPTGKNGTFPTLCIPLHIYICEQTHTHTSHGCADKSASKGVRPDTHHTQQSGAHVKQ